MVKRVLDVVETNFYLSYPDKIDWSTVIKSVDKDSFQPTVEFKLLDDQSIYNKGIYPDLTYIVYVGNVWSEEAKIVLNRMINLYDKKVNEAASILNIDNYGTALT